MRKDDPVIPGNQFDPFVALRLRFDIRCTSLRYLRAIHVDSIKTDAPLVTEILNDKNCQDTVQAIAQYAAAQKTRREIMRLGKQ